MIDILTSYHVINGDNGYFEIGQRVAKMFLEKFAGFVTQEDEMYQNCFKLEWSFIVLSEIKRVCAKCYNSKLFDLFSSDARH